MTTYTITVSDKGRTVARIYRDDYNAQRVLDAWLIRTRRASVGNYEIKSADLIECYLADGLHVRIEART